MERLPASLYLSPALFVIFAWVLSLSNSQVIQAKGITYYIGLGLVASWCTSYFIILAVFSIKNLLIKSDN
jgi:hypothetical protein